MLVYVLLIWSKWGTELVKNQMIHILNWQFNWKLKHLLQNSAYIFISPTIPKYKNKHDKPFFFFSLSLHLFLSVLLSGLPFLFLSRRFLVHQMALWKQHALKWKQVSPKGKGTLIREHTTVNKEREAFPPMKKKFPKRAKDAFEPSDKTIF